MNTISIHALRGEGDPAGMLCAPPRSPDFYPRPPWGGRPEDVLNIAQSFQFLSTPSVGRATYAFFFAIPRIEISIHALRGEGDVWRCGTQQGRYYFYPRPPWGGRRSMMVGAGRCLKISIHALRGEGDVWHDSGYRYRVDFYPRPPWGGRR